MPGDLTQPETLPAALFGVDRAFLFPAFNGCTPAPESCPTWTANASSTPTASPKGVYAGTLLIGALIEGSEAHRNASAWGGDRHVAVVPAEDLAERYWDMYLKRDRVEEEVAPALAASNVGLLSVLGMLMFHDFLAQFEDGAEYIKKQNPKFGLRWVTWPTNTFLEAVAWRNHPPAEGTPATVANAVGNLNRVRQLKRNAQHPHRSTGRHGDDLWAGPLADDVRARSRYGRSARQLRRLLQAVLSGALRRQAEELGVTLPEEYRDQPAAANRNTRDDDEPA